MDVDLCKNSKVHERSHLVKEVGGPGPTYLSGKAEDLNLSSCGVSKVLAQTKEK